MGNQVLFHRFASKRRQVRTCQGSQSIAFLLGTHLGTRRLAVTEYHDLPESSIVFIVKPLYGQAVKAVYENRSEIF